MSLLPRELLYRISRSNLVRQPTSRLLSTTSQLQRNVIAELEDRGMVADLTSRALRKHVDNPTSVYLGVDPSARSLHVGNLLALIGLLHFRLQGHSVIALIGGATGSIGDPSGRSTERNALSPEVLDENATSITKQVSTFLDRGVPFATSRTNPRFGSDSLEVRGGTVRVENNLRWLKGMGLLEFLSKFGKTARISTMLSRESVKSRLDSSSGLSFTEFSYQLLQAYDFLTLHQLHNCTIQLGGSDQLGNIVSGIDMIRKNRSFPPSTAALSELEPVPVEPEEEPAYGLTMPLLTTASGEKFGKSAGNAVWLDPSLTTPLEFYQFFYRTSDEEVLKYLKIFTFIRTVELEAIWEEHKLHPGAQMAQKILAAEATELVHGPEGLKQALAATQVFYGSSLDSLNIKDTIDALDAIPTTPSQLSIPSALVRLPAEDIIGNSLAHLVLSSGLIASKTQARKAIDSGIIQLNGSKIPARAHQRMIGKEDVLEGGLIVLRGGKSLHKAVLLVD